jgi:hypothetical protein
MAIPFLPRFACNLCARGGTGRVVGNPASYDATPCLAAEATEPAFHFEGMGVPTWAPPATGPPEPHAVDRPSPLKFQCGGGPSFGFRGACVGGPRGGGLG